MRYSANRIIEMESKIQVAETGNKRSSVSQADINQAILDIEQWFKTNVPDYYNENLKKGGAQADKIQQLGAPEHLNILLSKHDGGMQF